MSDLTVFKYQLRIEDVQNVTMPLGAELLHVGFQGDDLCLWGRVDPMAPRVQRRIRVAGTGHPDATGRYIGTVQLHGGALVFHVFDQTQE